MQRTAPPPPPALQSTRSRLEAAGSAAGFAVVSLLLAGALFLAIRAAATHDMGRPEAARAPLESAGEAANLRTRTPLVQPAAPVPVLFVVADESQAESIRAALAGELFILTALGEAPRAAGIRIAATDADVAALRALVFSQAHDQYVKIVDLRR